MPTIAALIAPFAQGTGGGASLMNTLIFIVPMILIFYFFLIRPQSKRASEHKEFLNNLKKGDDVVTGGGLYGKVVGLADQYITLEVADKVRVRVARGQITGLQSTDGAAQAKTS